MEVKEIIKKVEEAKLNDKMLERLLDALFDLAEGCYVAEDILIGKEVVKVRRYKKEPNREAAQFLTERILGKLPNTIKGEGEGGAIPVQITGIKYLIPNDTNEYGGNNNKTI